MSALLTFVFLCLLGIATGFESFQLQIPNGDRVVHPCNSRQEWPTVGHGSYSHTTRKNLFGLAWLRAGANNWTKVCHLDSDLDGLTNGEELGDPDCQWKFGERPRSDPIGHPGYCDSGREQCSTDERAIARDRFCSGITFRRRVRPTQAPGTSTLPRSPPISGMDHPQTHLTKGRVPSPWGAPSVFRPQPPSLPRFSGSIVRQPMMPSFPRDTPGFSGMAGLSVFGTRPSPQMFWRSGAVGFRPGTVSSGHVGSGGVFSGGSHSSPSGTRISPFGTGGTHFPIPGRSHTASSSFVSGGLSRPEHVFGFHAGRPPARTAGFVDSFPGHAPVAPMPETEGRIPSSGPSPLEVYRSRW